MSDQHWIENDKVRARFWATAKSEFGLEHDEVHEVLGVQSLKEYDGTFEDAVNALKAWEQEQLSRTLVSECQQLPESPVLAWTKFETPAGFVWHVSVRAGLPSPLARLALRQTVEQIRLFEEGADKMGWLPVADGRDVTAQPQRPGTAAQPPAPPAGAEARAAPPAQGTAPSRGNGKKEGSDPLKKIAVDADGRVEFYVGNFRYPFKDARGPEMVAGLFDPALGWTPAHFKPGAKYEADAVAGLVVDWEKPDRYYDVVLVHR